MAFSPSFIDILKERSDIEEIIGRHIQLKRAGSNLVGLCPFHNEKSPSFTVFSSTQNYYCFGCGAGGDVITFVMQQEGLDYPSAIEHLAKRAGLPVEETDIKGFEPTVKKERIIEITREAGKFFHNQLYSEEGRNALEYLHNRGFTDFTIRRFGIGFAPAGWNGLTDFLTSKNFTEKEMIAAFLAGRSKNGSLFDMFRNRVMFPVFDLNENPVAFSGRRLDESDERKYVNTSDTAAFKKSKILFGLNTAKKHSPESLILCEGAVDAVALQQAGFTNACATLGTAVTADHARIIARFVKMVYLSYDSDGAGKKATAKASNMFGELGVEVKIIDLGSDAKDPDEFIKKFGADAFRRRLSGSSGQIDYAVNEILSKYSISIPDEKLRAAKELYNLAAGIFNKTEREIYTARIADKLEITRGTAAAEVEKRAKSLAKKYADTAVIKNLQEQMGQTDKVNRDKLKFPIAAIIEEKILGILLKRPDLAPKALETLAADDFTTEFNKTVFLLFYDELSTGSTLHLSKDGVLTPPQTAAVSRMIAKNSIISQNNANSLEKLINNLKYERSKRELDNELEKDPLGGLNNFIEKLRNKANSD